MRLRNIIALVLTAVVLLPLEAWGQFNWPYTIQNGTIVTEVPKRPEGQRSALGLTVEKIPVVRVAFVGLGMRGPDAVERWTHIPGIEVKALCDYERDRAEACEEILRKASMPAADVFYGEYGYKDLCRRTDIDLVYIATDWLHHYPVAREALEHGHHVAIEVPSAMNLTEIWSLINLSESRRLHVMMLENCCYDFFELNSLYMAQRGCWARSSMCKGLTATNCRPIGTNIGNAVTMTSWGGVWTTTASSAVTFIPPTAWGPSRKCLTCTAATA